MLQFRLNMLYTKKWFISYSLIFYKTIIYGFCNGENQTFTKSNLDLNSPFLPPHSFPHDRNTSHSENSNFAISVLAYSGL